jgi:hypothetical protein
MVGHLPGNKLSLIESLGIIEQGFDLGNDDILTELVDIPLVFPSDIFGNIVDDGLFLF